MANEKQDYIIDEIKEMILATEVLMNGKNGAEKEKQQNIKIGLELAIIAVYDGTINYLNKEIINKESDFSKQILNQ